MSKNILTERDHKILGMWAENRTGSEIAEALGTTRGAILGRLHRLKAHGIDTAKRKLSESKKTETKPKPEGVLKATKPYKTVKVYFPPKPPIQTGNYLTVVSLKPQSCRFVVNDGEDGVFLFCGKEKEKGAYCGYHAKMCYIPQTTKKTKKSKEFIHYKYGRLDERRS